MGERIHPWSSDHTALVHELWRARREGIISRDADCDRLASLILRSSWLRAVKAHARERAEATH